jgi:hypothetical protein
MSEEKAVAALQELDDNQTPDSTGPQVIGEKSTVSISC